MDQLSPAADPSPQAPGSLGDGPTGQAEVPQRLPDAGQRTPLDGPPQVLLGNIVDPAELLAIVVSEVAELFSRRIRDDGGMGGGGGGGAVTCSVRSRCPLGFLTGGASVPRVVHLDLLLHLPGGAQVPPPRLVPPFGWGGPEGLRDPVLL